MKRAFLTELGLSTEQVDKVMGEYGKTVSSHKETVAEYVTEVKGLKQTVTDQATELKNNKPVDVEKVKSDALETYKKEIEKDLEKVAKFDELEKEFNTLKESETKRTYDLAVDTYLKDNKIKFANSYAQKDILNRFKESNFELKDDKFSDDALNFFNNLKENEKDAFDLTQVEDKAGFKYSPTQGTNNASTESMMSEIDTMLGIPKK